MTEVSAGIIRDGEGRVLVCKRGAGRRNAHLWEFPGGKREPGEDAVSCLKRELTEELRLPVSAVTPVWEAEEGGIRFTFLTGITAETPTLTEHEDARFAAPRELLSLPFCPADTPVARRLALSEPMVDAFLWDFDGTLFDTYPLMETVMANACAALGAEISPAACHPLMKESFGHCVRTLAARFGLETEALAQAYRAGEAAIDPAAYPLVTGMEETLRTLRARGGRHFLVTHRGPSARAALEAKGLLPCFTDLVTAEDGFPRKPDPTSVRALLTRHGIDPARAVMIGDRLLDTEAGWNAGALGMLFDTEDRFTDADCALRVRGAAEIAELCMNPL